MSDMSSANGLTVGAELRVGCGGGGDGCGQEEDCLAEDHYG